MEKTKKTLPPEFIQLLGIDEYSTVKLAIDSEGRK
jgi:hypothetical protein